MKRGLLGLVLALAATGCAGAPVAKTTRDEASPAETAWMADLCPIAGDLRTGLWTSAQAGEPLRQGLHDQLNTAAEEVAKTLDDLTTLSPSPVEGGDAAVRQFGDQLTDLRDALVRGRDELDALPPDAGADGLGRTVGEVWPDAAARAADPFAGVTVSTGMRTAAGPDCAQFSF